MGFRIHRGIFQKLNSERTAYENTFKIDEDGRIKEVDSEGNITTGYLKVGEQAADADTVDGLHSGSFLRSDTSDTFTGGNFTINSAGQYRVLHVKATRAAGLGTGSAGSNTPPFLFENAGGDQAWGVVAEFRINEDNRGGDSPAILFSDAQQSTQWTVGFDYTGSEFGIRKNRGIYSGGWGTSYFTINTSGKVFIPGEMEVDSRIYADNGVHVRGDWLRVNGSNGIYFESHEGGWHMTDSSWIRAYNSKNIYTGGNIEVGGTIRSNGNGFYVDSTNVINSSGQYKADVSNSTTNSRYFIQNAHGNPRNNLGSPTVTEMALFDNQFRCMTDLSNNYTNLDRVTFWVQQNEGDAWAEATVSDDQKKRFLRTNNSSVAIPNRAYKYRVEFKAPGYVYANALYFYWSSNSHSTKVHVYKYNASQDTWHSQATSDTNVSSWPGHLYLPFSTIPWHETHTTSTNHHRYIRVEFIPNWSGHATYGDRVINLSGGQIWGGYPSGRRTPHSIDHDGNYFFPARLYTDGGSGDGSILTDRDWVNSNTLNQAEGDARYLGISSKAADSNLLDGIDSGSFLRSDASDSFSGILTGTATAENLKVGGIRGTAKGSQTGEYIHLYERVHIGGPSGWGAASHGAPGQGLSTWGSVDFGMNGTGVIQLDGTTIVTAARALTNVTNTNWDAAYTKANAAPYINSSTQSRPDFNSLIPSVNTTEYKEVHIINEGSNFPSGAYTYGVVHSQKMGSMKFQWYVPHTASRGDNNTTDTIYFRTGWGASQIYGWQYLIHSGNIAGQSVSFATTAGSANAVTWGNVTGKPSTFAPSSHNHNSAYLGITAKAADSNLLDGLDSSQFVRAYGTTNDNIDSDWGQSFKTFDPVPAGTPPIESPNLRTINIGENFARRTQLAFTYATDQAWFRRKHNDTWHDWREFIHSGNIGSQSVNYAASSGSAGAVAWANVSGKPSTFAPSSHNHNYIYNTTSYVASGAMQSWDRQESTPDLNPTTDWFTALRIGHGHPVDYYSNTLAIQMTGGDVGRIYTRNIGNGNKGTWKKYWHGGDFTSTNISNWNTAYGWGNHASAGYVTSVTDALGYTPYQEGTALSASTIDAGSTVKVQAGHNDARMVIAYNHGGDSNSEYSGNLVMWTSEPGISYPGSGIGGNVHESGHYYGKRNTNIPYGVALRFNVTSGRAEFLTTSSTNNSSFRVGWYMDSNGNTVQQGSITASGYNKSNWDTAYGWGNHSSAGYLTSVPNLAASKITSGTFANARISQSSVTQHQSALSIAASQVSGLPAQTEPVQAVVEGGEDSTLSSITFNPGEGSATFTLADGQTFRLAFAR